LTHIAACRPNRTAIKRRALHCNTPICSQPATNLEGTAIEFFPSSIAAVLSAIFAFSAVNSNTDSASARVKEQSKLSA
jgi:hypothetical protein